MKLNLYNSYSYDRDGQVSSTYHFPTREIPFTFRIERTERPQRTDYGVLRLFTTDIDQAWQDVEAALEGMRAWLHERAFFGGITAVQLLYADVASDHMREVDGSREFNG